MKRKKITALLMAAMMTVAAPCSVMASGIIEET